jgi:PAS domain S-box-containing protein
VEIEALHRDGYRFPAELIVWPVKSHGGWSFSAFVADITGRKQTEVELAHVH